MPKVLSREESQKFFEPKIIAGTEKKKSPYTAEQTKDAGFALRMENSLKTIEALEKNGFSPVNLRDYLLETAPVLGGSALFYYLSSPEYKQYQRAKLDFATAQLRKETGAVIAQSEIEWINLTYFPEFGDDEIVLKDKAKARRTATLAMKSSAGKAYDEIIEEEKKQPQNDDLVEMAMKRFYDDENFRNQILQEVKENEKLYNTLVKEGLFSPEGTADNPMIVQR